MTIGVIAGAGGLFRFPRAVGYHHAMELMLTGELFDAARARGLGLLNDVVPGTEVLPRAREIARRIAWRAASSPVLVSVARPKATVAADTAAATGLVGNFCAARAAAAMPL